MSSMEAAEAATTRTPRDHQRSFDLEDLLRQGRSTNRYRLDLPPEGVSTRHMPCRSLLTVTRNQSGAGQLWKEPGSQGRGCRTEDSRGPVLEEGDSSGDDADGDPNEEEAADSGSDEGSSTWSTTTLVLAANCLEHARETLVQLSRQQSTAQ